jgi:hypothetical protein
LTFAAVNLFGLQETRSEVIGAISLEPVAPDGELLARIRALVRA